MNMPDLHFLCHIISTLATTTVYVNVSKAHIGDTDIWLIYGCIPGIIITTGTR